MKNLIVGIILGIFITVFSYNIMPYLHSQASSSDIRSISYDVRSIVRELRYIKNSLDSINNNLKKY